MMYMYKFLTNSDPNTRDISGTSCAVFYTDFIFVGRPEILMTIHAFLFPFFNPIKKI